MRHHISAVAISVVMTLISSSVLAEMKIAFVDVQRAILSSEQAKKLQAQIGEEFKDEEAEIRQVSSDAAAQIKRLHKDSQLIN